MHAQPEGARSPCSDSGGSHLRGTGALGQCLLSPGADHSFRSRDATGRERSGSRGPAPRDLPKAVCCAGKRLSTEGQEPDESTRLLAALVSAARKWGSRNRKKKARSTLLAADSAAPKRVLMAYPPRYHRSESGLTGFCANSDAAEWVWSIWPSAMTASMSS